MNFLSYKSVKDLMRTLVKDVKLDLEQAIKHKNTATFVVPGGTTPGPLFDLLSTTDIEWNKVTVFSTDERWVETDSPRSNFGLIKRRLLKGPASNANLLALFQKNKNSIDGAHSLSKSVSKHLPIDVLILGMGTDMHTASLFPNAEELIFAQSINAPAVVPIIPTNRSLEPRVTLSAKSLETAFKTHVLVIGDDKKVAIKKAVTLEPSSAPISQFLNNAFVHWCSK